MVSHIQGCLKTWCIAKDDFQLLLIHLSQPPHARVIGICHHTHYAVLGIEPKAPQPPQVAPHLEPSCSHMCA